MGIEDKSKCKTLVTPRKLTSWRVLDFDHKFQDYNIGFFAFGFAK